MVGETMVEPQEMILVPKRQTKNQRLKLEVWGWRLAHCLSNESQRFQPHSSNYWTGYWAGFAIAVAAG
jgi:hypothetical protein